MTTASKIASHSTAVDAPLRKSVFAELAHSGNSMVPGVSRSKVARPKIAFVDVSSEQGIEFTYQNGTRGDQLMVEATGGGCSWFDYDRDILIGFRSRSYECQLFNINISDH